MKRTIRIDASSMGDLHCFLKFYRRVVENYVLHKEKLDMSFGSAWHIFRQELALSDGNVPHAIGAGVKYLKEALVNPDIYIPDTKAYLANPGYFVGLCMGYIGKFGETDKNRDFQYLRDSKEKPLVEQTFSIRVYEDDIIEVLLQGTIDEIGRFKNGGCVAFGDDKTTGSYKIEPYLAEHELKNQLLTYAWALRWMSNQADSSNPYKNVLAGRIAGFINGVFLKKNVNDCEFHRSKIFFFNEELLDEYEVMVRYVCKTLSYSLSNSTGKDFAIRREGILNNTCAGNYGECIYTPVCRAPNREVGQRILEANYKLKPYQPLSFRKGIQV